MARWKLTTALALAAALLAACGGEAAPAATTTGASPLTYYLTIDDSGDGVLRVAPGEEIVPRLPLSGPNDPGWQLVVFPNPSVLGGGDDLRFIPSEAGQGGVAYQEFSFTAVGPGRTSFILTRGVQRFVCNVEVAPAG